MVAVKKIGKKLAVWTRRRSAEIPAAQKAALLSAAFFYSFAAAPILLKKAVLCLAALASSLFFARKMRLAFFACFAALFAMVSLGFSQKPCECGLEREKIVKVEGRIAANPAKSFSQNYQCALEVSRVFGEETSASASGKVAALIPQAIVEANWREKIHSKAKKFGMKSVGFPVEIGLKAQFYGEFSGGFFKVSRIENAKFSSRFDEFRAKCRLKLRRLLHEWGDAGGLLLALLSGARDAIAGEVADGFKRAGLSHVLALSGMHVSLFSSFALAVGKRTKSRKLGFTLSFGAVAAFVWFAGLSPSLLRAFLCAVFSMTAQILFARADALSILSAAFLAHLLIASADAVQISFLLSYGAVAGILIFDGICRKSFLRVMPRLVAAQISPSIAAQIPTTPICAAFFAKVMPIGIVSSVFASPLASAFLLFGFFAALPCLAIPALIPPLGAVLNAIYFVLKTVVLFFAKFPPISLG